MVSPASRLLSVAALAALVFAAPGMALAQNGRIRGVVRDAGGDPLSGVTIRAQGVGAAHRATTGSDGSYSIANLSPGSDLEVQVTVRNVGSRPGRETVQAYLEGPPGDAARPIRVLGGFEIGRAHV